MAAHERTLQTQLEGIDDDQAEMLAVARVILAAATKDDVSFNTAEIAAKVGLPVETVRMITKSPVYQAVLRDQFLSVASHALTNGARQMDKIIQGDFGPQHKVAAYRALVETIRAFDQSGGKPPAPAPEDEYEQWLKEQQKRNAGSRRTRHHPQAEQEEGD